MPAFPVHTDHSFESPVALDRFNQHSTGWKRYAKVSNFSAFRCLINRRNGSRQAIPRHHSTHSYSVARHVCSLSRFRWPRLFVFSLKVAEKSKLTHRQNITRLDLLPWMIHTPNVATATKAPAGLTIQRVFCFSRPVRASLRNQNQPVET